MKKEYSFRVTNILYLFFLYFFVCGVLLTKINALSFIYKYIMVAQYFN